MKKVLVAGAALMLAGSMVSAASAEVNLSGDARVRWIYKDKYQFGNKVVNGVEQDATNNLDSRVRVKIEGKAKGGAFAKARLRLDDIKWNGQYDDVYKESKNVWVDYAYLGIPIGELTISGGQMPDDYTKFFSWDEYPTRLKLDWNGGKVRLIGVMDVEPGDIGWSEKDSLEGNNHRGYGLIAAVDFTEDWAGKAYVRYQDDQRSYEEGSTVDEFGNSPGRSDNSGWLGDINITGKVGDFGLEAELAAKESDVQGSVDDGIGGFIQGSFTTGAWYNALQFGFTQDAYVVDDDFGFIMMGGDEPITVFNLGNPYGDSLWVGYITRYQISEQLRVAGNLVYYDIDVDVANAGTDIRRLMDTWELSGSITYVISEGADFTWKAGILTPDFDGERTAAGVQDDTAFGTYGRLQIKF